MGAPLAQTKGGKGKEMRNRDKIRNQNLYDFLLMLNERLLNQAGTYCVYDILTEEQHLDACRKFNGDCGLCIEAFLNAEAGE